MPLWIIVLMAMLSDGVLGGPSNTLSCTPAIWCNTVWNVIPCCDNSSTVMAAEMETCGRQFINKTNKIYGGKEAEIGEFPWLVPIYYLKRRRPVCAGSILNSRWVISAGHCVKGDILWSAGRPTVIRYGDHDLSSQIDCKPEKVCNQVAIDRVIGRYFAHPEFVPGSKNSYNDISLLQVTEAIKYTPFIQPICLPGKNEKFVNRSKMHVAGWGRTPTLSSSNIKLKTMVPLRTNAVCDNAFRNQSIAMANSQLCAGGEDGIDTCSGDSGGPLMYAGPDNVWKIYGIVSFGTSACGMKDFPAIYTKVSYYLDWINQNIQS